METTTSARKASKQAPAPAIAPEVVAASAVAQLGIAYSDTFTLPQAIASYNATRKAVTLPDGGEVAAETLHFKPSEEWLTAHPGTFKVRRASLFDRVRMQAGRDQLLGLGEVSVGTEWLADALMTCKHQVVEAPEWFDLDTLDDSNVAFLVHHWVSEWEGRFRR